MNIRKVNLNLIVALEALLGEQSVTCAANKLAITQAAMSNALRRLRELLNDPLLVRSGKHMVLTPKAKSLKPQIHGLLADIKKTIDPQDTFDPKISTCNFHIAMFNTFAHLISQKAFLKIYSSAPNVKFTILNTPISNLFNTTSCDLLMAPQQLIPKNLYSESIFCDYLVCVGAKNNPILKNKLNVSSFLGAEHVQLESKKGNSEILSGKASSVLAKRNIRLCTPYISIALSTLERTNMIGIIPASVAAELGAKFMIQELPFKVPRVSICQAWPKHLDNDSAHQWLRSTIAMVKAAS